MKNKFTINDDNRGLVEEYPKLTIIVKVVKWSDWFIKGKFTKGSKEAFLKSSNCIFLLEYPVFYGRKSYSSGGGILSFTITVTDLVSNEVRRFRSTEIYNKFWENLDQFEILDDY